MMKKLFLLAGILALGTTSLAIPEDEIDFDKDGHISAQDAVDIATSTDNAAILRLVAGRQEETEEQEGLEFSGTYGAGIKYRSYQGPGRGEKEENGNYTNSGMNKLEWTLAKGKLNMGKLGFAYSVERDFNFDKDFNSTSQGWDTSFGFDYQVGEFEFLNRTWEFNPYISFEYDNIDSIRDRSSREDKSSYDIKRLVKFSPMISTTYYGFATDIRPIVAYDDIQGTTAFQLDIGTYRRLSDHWITVGDIYFDFIGNQSTGPRDDNGKKTYANGLRAGNIDRDNNFAFSLEQYLIYERNIFDNVYFIAEFGLEAYSIFQTDASDISLYASPEVQYRCVIQDTYTVTPYVKYTTYTSAGWGGGSPYKEEVSAGMRFGMSF